MFLCIKPDNVRLQGATNSSTVTILYIAGYCWRAVHPYSILVLPGHSWLKNKYLICLKLGCLSLLWPSGLVCKLVGTPLPVIGETEVRLMDASALPVLVTETSPHELRISSDAISRGDGKIDYRTRRVTSFDQNFSITPYTD